MYEYKYTRELVNWKIDPQDPESETMTGYDIDHPIKIAKSDFLAKLIKLSSLAKGCKVICDAEKCSIFFYDELTTEQKTMLDSLVADNKKNV